MLVGDEDSTKRIASHHRGGHKQRVRPMKSLTVSEAYDRRSSNVRAHQCSGVRASRNQPDSIIICLYSVLPLPFACEEYRAVVRRPLIGFTRLNSCPVRFPVLLKIAGKSQIASSPGAGGRQTAVVTGHRLLIDTSNDQSNLDLRRDSLCVPPGMFGAGIFTLNVRRARLTFRLIGSRDRPCSARSTRGLLISKLTKPAAHHPLHTMPTRRVGHVLHRHSSCHWSFSTPSTYSNRGQARSSKLSRNPVSYAVVGWPALQTTNLCLCTSLRACITQRLNYSPNVPHPSVMFLTLRCFKAGHANYASRATRNARASPVSSSLILRKNADLCETRC